MHRGGASVTPCLCYEISALEELDQYTEPDLVDDAELNLVRGINEGGGNLYQTGEIRDEDTTNLRYFKTVRPSLFPELQHPSHRQEKPSQPARVAHDMVNKQGSRIISPIAAANVRMTAMSAFRFLRASAHHAVDHHNKDPDTPDCVVAPVRARRSYVPAADAAVY